MSDQNKSDWLTEHLLHWKKDYAAWFDGDAPVVGVQGSKDAWQPHEKIEQCFAYLIPAMKGWGFSIMRTDAEWSAQFISPAKEQGYARHENPAAAIVEACYAALQEK